MYSDAFTQSKEKEETYGSWRFKIVTSSTLCKNDLDFFAILIRIETTEHRSDLHWEMKPSFTFLHPSKI